MNEIYKETSRHLMHGHVTAGTTRIPLTEGSYPVNRGVLLRAPGTLEANANTAPVWVGGKRVTADASSTGGMPIPPGQALFIPIEDTSLLYVISTAEGQDLAWMAM
jgi:hypothetical protein